MITIVLIILFWSLGVILSVAPVMLSSRISRREEERD